MGVALFELGVGVAGVVEGVGGGERDLDAAGCGACGHFGNDVAMGSVAEFDHGAGEVAALTGGEGSGEPVVQGAGAEGGLTEGDACGPDPDEDCTGGRRECS